MSPRYVAVRGSATADSVCAKHPALDASMDLTASVMTIHVLDSVGSSVEVSFTFEYYRYFIILNQIAPIMTVCS